MKKPFDFEQFVIDMSDVNVTGIHVASCVMDALWRQKYVVDDGRLVYKGEWHDDEEEKPAPKTGTQVALFNVGDTVCFKDDHKAKGTIMTITNGFYVCDTMCFPINQQEDMMKCKPRPETLDELSTEYGDGIVVYDKTYEDYDISRRKSLTKFDVYSIEEAYEDGAKEILGRVKKLISDAKYYSDVSVNTRLYEELKKMVKKILNE